MKKLFRHIRYRICRSIYYADQCPVENKKNYRRIITEFLLMMATSIIFTFLVAFFLLIS